LCTSPQDTEEPEHPLALALALALLLFLTTWAGLSCNSSMVDGFTGT
jgi:hypothetical protein